MVGVLGALRMLPEVVGHFLHGERPAKPVSMRLRDMPEIPMAEGGWVLLGERPGEEIALGLVGKFWRPVIEFAPIEGAEEFRSFDKAGFAKTVYDLSASELEPGRTLLTGLMRTATTDERPPLVPPLLDLRRRLGPPHPRRGTARLRAARRRRRRGGEAMRSRRFWAVWNRTVNPVVRLVLRSPLHGLLSRRTALITVIGRRSGREFTFPVGYEQRGDSVPIMVGSPEHKRWWRNLTDPGARVRMRLRGGERSGHAVARGDQRSGVTVEIAFDHPGSQ